MLLCRVEGDFISLQHFCFRPSHCNLLCVQIYRTSAAKCFLVAIYFWWKTIGTKTYLTISCQQIEASCFFTCKTWNFVNICPYAIKLEAPPLQGRVFWVVLFVKLCMRWWSWSFGSQLWYFWRFCFYYFWFRSYWWKWKFESKARSSISKNVQQTKNKDEG